jgi:galactonate dehydratase
MGVIGAPQAMPISYTFCAILHISDLAAATTLSNMKITKLTTYRVPPRWMLLKIETDEGVVGWGEPVIEGKARTVETAVREMEPYLVGQDPARINDLWQAMYRGGFYRGGPILMSAIAGIDQALWDIKGKVLGAPVYELLGGLVRDRMKTYSWVGGDRPADVIAGIRKLREAGFDTFKMNGTEEMGIIDSAAKVDAAVARIAEIRSAFGYEIEFGLDFHGRVSAPMAKVLLRALEPYRPLFVEEPVLAEQAEYYPRLAESTFIPLAAGERMFSRFEFKRVFAAGGLSIVQPDLSHAGGITECVKIAAMAEAYDIALAPHCPLGPVALAACLQVDFVAHNAVLQEQSMGIHYNQGAELLDYVKNRDHFRLTDGYIAPLPLPGLGVEIDEERVIEASRNAPDWRNPLWRHADGSVAEW